MFCVRQSYFGCFDQISRIFCSIYTAFSNTFFYIDKWHQIFFFNRLWSVTLLKLTGSADYQN